MLHAELFAARQAVLLAQAFCPVGAMMIYEGDSSLALATMKGHEGLFIIRTHCQ